MSFVQCSQLGHPLERERTRLARHRQHEPLAARALADDADLGLHFDSSVTEVMRACADRRVHKVCDFADELVLRVDA
jgi:hypothetical protein